MHAGSLFATDTSGNHHIFANIAFGLHESIYLALNVLCVCFFCALLPSVLLVMLVHLRLRLISNYRMSDISNTRPAIKLLKSLRVQLQFSLLSANKVAKV